MGDFRNMGVSLADLVRALSGASGQPPRQEPWMNDPAHEAGLRAVGGATDPGARMEPTVSGETAHVRGTEAVDAEMDKASTEAWRDKMKAAKDAKRAGAAGEAAVAKAVQPTKAEEKLLTQGWIERMRNAKIAKGEGAKAVEAATAPTSELGLIPRPDISFKSGKGADIFQSPPDWQKAEAAKGASSKAPGGKGWYAPNVPQYLVDEFGPPPPPMTDAEEARWHGEHAVAHELADIKPAEIGPETYNPFEWQTALREAMLRNMTPGQLAPPGNDLPLAPFSTLDMPPSQLPGVAADAISGAKPMVPPGGFGPHMTMNPETETTGPQPNEQLWLNHLRSLGLNAVEKGLEE